MLVFAWLAATASGASITVTPSTGLDRSGHSVTVAGTGFDPSEPVEVHQCREQENAGACHSLGYIDSDGAGSFSGAMQVTYTSAQLISCEDPYCRVFAVSESGAFSQFVPISFAGGTSTTSTPSPGSEGAIALGGAATDTAVVTGNASSGSPTGQMSFFVCGPDGYVVCHDGGDPVPGNPRPLVAGANDTASATSGSFTPPAPGRYCFRSVYSGSGSYGASYDARQSECFYAKSPSTISATVTPGWIRANEPNERFTDSAVVTGNAAGGVPTGVVVFFICRDIPEPAVCDQGGTSLHPRDLVPGPDNTAQASTLPARSLTLGRTCLRAEYRGDRHYFASTASGPSQCFVVGYYPRPKAPSPVRVSLVPAFDQCTNPNREHGAPLSHPSCSPPMTTSNSVFVGGIGGGDPAPAKSVGFVRLGVTTGSWGEPDDADVNVSASITNVMQVSDRSDYTGELQTVLRVRLTDREADARETSQTVEDFPFRITVPCTATADATIGATCAITTTADTVMPGAVREEARSIWGLDAVQVYDGGSDGAAGTTQDNRLFATQGVFVP